MAEENEKKVQRPETQYHAPVVDADGTRDKDYIVITVGTSKKSLEKYELVLPVPNIQELAESGATVADLSKWFEDNWKQDLQETVNAAGRNRGYRPPYDTCVDREAEPEVTPDPTGGPDFIDYPLVANGHAQMQQLLDQYEPGRRATGGASMKAKAKKADEASATIQEKYGMSFDEFMEKVKAGEITL